MPRGHLRRGVAPKRIRRSISGYVSGERLPNPTDPTESLTYDALLVARHGLGADEQRLASDELLEAVRWVLFAEKAAPELAEWRRVVGMKASELDGQARIDLMASQRVARDLVKRAVPILFPEDDDG